MKLTQYLREAGYDLIEGPVRDHKLLQLWLKKTFDKAEYFHEEIGSVFNSSVQLTIEEDPALRVDTTKSDEYAFNIGVSLLGKIFEAKPLGLDNFDLSTIVKSGKMVSISYDNCVTKKIPTGKIEDYLHSADFKNPNQKVLLNHLNQNNILVITGVLMAQNLVVEIETDFDFDANLVATLNQAADGKLTYTAKTRQKLKMVSSNTGLFPIAVKANRIDYDKGVFKGIQLVTDKISLF
jgi:hypothetical protein